MSGWTAKRFWKAARSEKTDAGWQVRLDDRTIHTPGKSALVLPSAALAKAIAAEWDAQSGVIDPRTMPLTRAANSAIEKVTPQRVEVVAMLAAYGETDLLCYRAVTPEALAQRQADAWDPLLAWSAKALGAPLTVAAGVVPLAQPAQSLDRLKTAVGALDPFALTGLHDLVTIPGSLIIGLAAYHRHIAPENLWALAEIDEAWQAEVWGHDDEAAEARALKRRDFLQAVRFLDLVRAPA